MSEKTTQQKECFGFNRCHAGCLAPVIYVPERCLHQSGERKKFWQSRSSKPVLASGTPYGGWV